MVEERISEEDLRKILKGRGIEPELDGIVAMLDQFPDRIEVVLDGKFTIKRKLGTDEYSETDPGNVGVLRMPHNPSETTVWTVK